jgi:hypothetical protein
MSINRIEHFVLVHRLANWVSRHYREMVPIYSGALGRTAVYDSIVTLRNELQKLAEALDSSASTDGEFLEREQIVLESVDWLDNEICLKAIDAVTARASATQTEVPRPPRVFHWALSGDASKEFIAIRRRVGEAAKRLNEVPVLGTKADLKGTLGNLRAREPHFRELMGIRDRLDEIEDEIKKASHLHRSADLRFASFLAMGALALLVITVIGFVLKGLSKAG